LVVIDSFFNVVSIKVFNVLELRIEIGSFLSVIRLEGTRVHIVLLVEFIDHDDFRRDEGLPIEFINFLLAFYHVQEEIIQDCSHPVHVLLVLLFLLQEILELIIDFLRNEGVLLRKVLVYDEQEEIHCESILAVSYLFIYEEDFP